jgi:hypothetical protein
MSADHPSSPPSERPVRRSAGLDEAVRASRLLTEQLQQQIRLTRQASGTLGSLDSEALFAYAEQRQVFHNTAERLQRVLAQALARAGSELGVKTVTLASLHQQAPAQARALAAAFSDLRRFAAELDALDTLHREMLERSLQCVRGYLSAVQPRATAYDRRGAGSPTPESSTVSRRI